MNTIAEKKSLMEWCDTTYDELWQLMQENPSLRGIIFGYIAELKARKFLLKYNNITQIIKIEDHNKLKGDLAITYKNFPISLECKSLVAHETKTGPKCNPHRAKSSVLCKATDKHEIVLPNGNTINTAYLIVGQFDILAVNLFGFYEEWQFAFAFNGDLARINTSKKYKKEDCLYLLKGQQKITIPLAWPFVEDPTILMELLLKGITTLPKY